MSADIELNITRTSNFKYCSASLVLITDSHQIPLALRQNEDCVMEWVSHTLHNRTHCVTMGCEAEVFMLV